MTNRSNRTQPPSPVMGRFNKPRRGKPAAPGRQEFTLLRKILSVAAELRRKIEGREQ